MQGLSDATIKRMSHDLRAPVRQIQQFTSILSDKLEKHIDPEGRECIDWILDCVMRANRYLDSLTEYSNVCSSEERSEYSLPDVLDGVLRDLDSSDRIRVDIPEALPPLEGRPRDLHVMFRHLLSNALKFHDEGAEAAVRIVVTRDQSEIRVDVHDNGVGVPGSSRERIFDLFEVAHSRRRYPGAGVGLAVARRVARHHGGDITIAPSDLGSTFVLRLPVAGELAAG